MHLTDVTTIYIKNYLGSVPISLHKKDGKYNHPLFCFTLVSKEEMKDIESLYGKPSSAKEVAYTETIEI